MAANEPPFLLHDSARCRRLLFFLFLYGSLEISYRLGLRSRRLGRGKDQDSRGDTVLASMLAMLGLVLAFTYSFTVTRSDNRKAASLEEVNALGTAFARADLLHEPHRTRLKTRLYEFAHSLDIDDKEFRKAEEIQETIDRVTKSQAAIWPTTRAAVKSKDAMGPQETALVQSINDLMDSHTARIQAAFDRLPTAIHLMLLFIAAASLSVAGYSSGRADTLRRWRMSCLILVITAIMVVIMDFDRPGSGFVRNNLTIFEQLISEMEADLSINPDSSITP